MGHFFRSRAFIGMCIIAVLLTGLGLLSMSERGRVTIIEDFVGIVITPLQKASNRLVKAAGNFKKVFTEYDLLQEENTALKEQLAAAEDQLRDAEEDIVENKTLRGALGLAEENPDMQFVSAHISGSDMDSYAQTLTLDCGSVHGVSARDMVVTGEGIVGYVSEVGTTWCKVMTILDPSCEIGVVLTRTGTAAVLQGDATMSADGRCKTAYLKNDITLTVGDSIETSGIGGLFPDGLFVGRVREIKSESTGLSQYAVVEPAVDIKNISTVLIITEFLGQEE
ncbi:MAG: rod shape-determining protein MreC [Clostridia bacterium]|nr:rod shape-determining protein MreC [Clostridia bacterium]